MIAVGTNVLVRPFVNDDVAQAGRVRAVFAAGQDDSLWIADVVLAELVWALDQSRPPSSLPVPTHHQNCGCGPGFCAP